MNMRVYRMPSADVASSVVRSLFAASVDAHQAWRQHSTYVVVKSDRADIDDLVRGGAPAAVPVNLTHLPLPAAGDAAHL